MKRTVCRRPTSDCALLPTMVGVRSALQIQKAVTAYLKSKQLLPFGFAQQHCQSKNILPELSFGTGSRVAGKVLHYYIL